MGHALPLLLGDLVLVTGAWVAALVLRYDAGVPAHAWAGLARFLPVAVLVTLVVYALAGLYNGLLRFASILEARQILSAQAAALAITLGIVYFRREVPLSVPVIATMLTCGAAGALRFWSRLLRWQHYAGVTSDNLMVVGAGEAGSALIRDMKEHSGVKVVGVLDDDPHLWGRRVHGIRVVGGIADLETQAQQLEVARVVLAIASAHGTLVRDLANRCGELGIGLSIVPPASELVGRQVSLQDVRDLEIADLLGREQVEGDLTEIQALVEGRRVLVTGGGGSIGSELGRQLAAFAPASLVLLDHDETHLFDAGAEIPGAVLCLCDIRDHASLDRAFARHRPEVVFHAAAHKHVPLLEEHPLQAAHTNVLGTAGVVAAARRHGARRFVFISTDKAVRPSSVMGATKLVGEHLVLDADLEMQVSAVRFGNVLGSRGSVVPTFVRQIRAGGPVTITDARMTRYFMSIPEAVRLVLHAAALSRGGEIFMLDMGEPVRIIDLARRMIQLSGQVPGTDIEIRVTAARPGEKLTELLRAPDERQHPTSHPSIVRLEPVRLPALPFDAAVDAIRRAVADQDETAVRSTLSGLLRSRESAGASLPIPQQPTGDRTQETAWA